MNIGQNIRRWMTLVALLALVAGALPATAASRGAQSPGAPIDPWVLRTTEDGATTSFLVVLKTQADTSGAAALATKTEKGRYVFERLYATAQSTQGSLKQYLDARGVTYRAFWIVNALVIDAGDRALALDLAARPEVDRISGNPTVHVDLGGPSAAAEQASRLRTAVETVAWGIQNANAPLVWSAGYTGTGIVVGGEDTGYRWTHVALKSKYRGWDGATADHDYSWHDAVHSGGGSCGANAAAPCDDWGHGTHTMGTMVGGDGDGPDAYDVGMAYGAQWIGCRNMNVGDGSPDMYIECHEFMLAPTPVAGGTPDPDKAPHVINNSWTCTTGEGCTDVNILQASVQALVDAGIVYVASAGNAGSSCSSVSQPPAIYAASLTVGAIDVGNNLAGFSSRGPVTSDGSNRRKPDISAPGVNILSSTIGSDTEYQDGWDGTSMAGPHVAGAVALLLDMHPELIGQVALVRTLLETTANPGVNATGTCGGIPATTIPNNHFGYGRLDVYSAATHVVNVYFPAVLNAAAP